MEDIDELTPLLSEYSETGETDSESLTTDDDNPLLNMPIVNGTDDVSDNPNIKLNPLYIFHDVTGPSKFEYEMMQFDSSTTIVEPRNIVQQEPPKLSIHDIIIEPPVVHHYTVKKIGGKRLKQTAVTEDAIMESEIEDYISETYGGNTTSSTLKELDDMIEELNRTDVKFGVSNKPRLPPPLPPKPMNGLKELINVRNRRKSQSMLINNGGNYECSLCGAIAESDKVLSEHYTYAHGKYLRTHYGEKLYNKLVEIDPEEEEEEVVDLARSLCRCLRCNRVFNNDSEYHKHICSNANSGQPEDEMPVDPNGKFECPICKNKYASSNILGEHFIMAHNNYNELGTLDETINTNGFPGFDILEELFMIDVLDNDKIDDIIKREETCPICCYNFRKPIDCYVPEDDGRITGYNSDSELLESNFTQRLHVPVPKRCKSHPKLTKKYFPQRNITDEHLVAKINKIRQRPIYPVLMRCCDLYICYDCLRSTLEIANNLICPFCRFDHCKVGMDVFTIVEPGYYDPAKWIPWWTDHLYLFD